MPAAILAECVMCKSFRICFMFLGHTLERKKTTRTKHLHMYSITEKPTDLTKEKKPGYKTHTTNNILVYLNFLSVHNFTFHYSLPLRIFLQNGGQNQLHKIALTQHTMATNNFAARLRRTRFVRPGGKWVGRCLVVHRRLSEQDTLTTTQRERAGEGLVECTTNTQKRPPGSRSQAAAEQAKQARVRHEQPPKLFARTQEPKVFITFR